MKMIMIYIVKFDGDSNWVKFVIINLFRRRILLYSTSHQMTESIDIFYIKNNPHPLSLDADWIF